MATQAKRSARRIKKKENQMINGSKHAGTHLLVDFWFPRFIESPRQIEKALIQTAKRANNTPLEVTIHKFSPKGITGVILLAESHIALHSWPELNYLGIDIFTCGEKSMPYKALDYLKLAFRPKRTETREIKRGVLDIFSAPSRESKPSEINMAGDWHFDRSFDSVGYLNDEETGARLGLEVKKRIFSGRSPYQEIEIIETKPYGKALILDGIMQTAEKDEFLYHEMFVHPAMMLQKKAETALVIGGGDGGCLREILKYPCVKKVFLAEIDKKVVELCREYLPSLSGGAFQDPRVEMVFSDGFSFVKKYRNFFDVIIVDSSDPVGPAQKLFTEKFYKNLFFALKEQGCVVIQAGLSSVLQKNEVANDIAVALNKSFKSVEARFVFVPSYTYNGLQTFVLASKTDSKSERRGDIEKKFRESGVKTRYYNPGVHFASKAICRI